MKTCLYLSFFSFNGKDLKDRVNEIVPIFSILFQSLQLENRIFNHIPAGGGVKLTPLPMAF